MRARLPLLLAALGAALLVSYAIQVARVSQSDIGRSDFTATYVGATLLRTGHGAGLYDEALQAPLHASLIAPDLEGNLPFVAPPTAAALALPLTALSLTGAYWTFALLQLGLLTAAVTLATRAAPWPAAITMPTRIAVGVLALAGTGTLSLLLLGQWDGLVALGVAGAYALWRSDRRAAAGLVLALGCGLAKPHLALGLAVLVLVRRDRRLLLGAAAGAIALAAAALVLAGPHGVAGFAAAAGDSTHRWRLASMLGFTGLFGSWLGDGTVPQVLAAVGSALALGAAGVLGAAWRRDETLLEPALAGATALSLLAAPHLLGHDLAVLAPACVIAAGWAASRDAATRRAVVLAGGRLGMVMGGWLALLLAGRLDLGNDAAAPPGRLVPWVLAGAGAAAAAACIRVPRGAPSVALRPAGAGAP